MLYDAFSWQSNWAKVVHLPPHSLPFFSASAKHLISFASAQLIAFHIWIYFHFKIF